MQNYTFLVILAGLLIAVSVYGGISGWRTHQERRQKTADRGWRYTNTYVQSLFRSAYIIAGTSPNGIVWELQRNQRKGMLFFVWTTTFAPLPYGTIRILPRRMSALRQDPSLMRLTIWQHERWQNPALADYVLYTSHQQLGERFLTADVALALSYWPEWPLPGSLEEVTWSHDALEIRVRYLGDWITADRLVALGLALVGNLGPQWKTIKKT